MIRTAVAVELIVAQSADDVVVAAAAADRVRERSAEQQIVAVAAVDAQRGLDRSLLKVAASDAVLVVATHRDQPIGAIRLAERDFDRRQHAVVNAELVVRRIGRRVVGELRPSQPVVVRREIGEPHVRVERTFEGAVLIPRDQCLPACSATLIDHERQMELGAVREWRERFVGQVGVITGHTGVPPFDTILRAGRVARPRRHEVIVHVVAKVEDAREAQHALPSRPDVERRIGQPGENRVGEFDVIGRRVRPAKQPHLSATLSATTAAARRAGAGEIDDQRVRAAGRIDQHVAAGLAEAVAMRERCRDRQELETRVGANHVVARLRVELRLLDVARLIERELLLINLQAVRGRRAERLRADVPNQAAEFVAMQRRVVLDRREVRDVEAAPIRVAPQKQHSVVARPAGKQVAGRGQNRRRRGIEDCVRLVELQRQRVGNDLERVVASASEQQIGRVAISAAGDHVVARLAEDPILARAAAQDVIAVAAENHVAAVERRAGRKTDLFHQIRRRSEVELQAVNRRREIRFHPRDEGRADRQRVQIQRDRLRSRHRQRRRRIRVRRERADREQFQQHRVGG